MCMCRKVFVFSLRDIVWESDLEILNAVTNGSRPMNPESVVAKYL